MKRQIPCWVIGSFLISLLIVSACSSEEEIDIVSQQVDSSGSKVWTRLFTSNPTWLISNLQKQHINVTGSNHRLGFVDIHSSVEAREQVLQRFNSADEIIYSEDITPERSSASMLSLYHHPQEVSDFMDKIQAEYPDIALKVLLSDQLFEGQKIYAMKISDHVKQDEDEPTFILDGQMHAREFMTVEVAMDAMEYLTSHYAIDAEVKRWVDEMEIWIVPVVNPDGATYAFKRDRWWRVNRNPDCAVDINRNFSWSYRACWFSTDLCDADEAHGPAANSEPETQTMAALFDELRAMYYLNYHSYGEYILWPGGCKSIDDDALLREMGEQLNMIVKNDAGKTGEWTIGPTHSAIYSAPGSAIDEAYGAYGTMAFTFEINSRSFQPDYDAYRDITVKGQRAGWQYLLKRTLDGPSVNGHVVDATTGEPVIASYEFSNRPFTSGQLPLKTDKVGRFGHAVMANSTYTITVRAAGYLPETREVEVVEGPADIGIIALKRTENKAPTADAGVDGISASGALVTLDGSKSVDPDGEALTFAWVQIAGPSVILNNADTVNPSFSAPIVTEDTVLMFNLIVNDGTQSSAPDSVKLTIKPNFF